MQKFDVGFLFCIFLEGMAPYRHLLLSHVERLVAFSHLEALLRLGVKN